MDKLTLNVSGMSCSHCENAIKKAVGALEGVKKVLVSLEENTVTVEFDGSKLTRDKIEYEIEDQGYDVV